MSHNKANSEAGYLFYVYTTHVSIRRPRPRAGDLGESVGTPHIDTFYDFVARNDITLLQGNHDQYATANLTLDQIALLELTFAGKSYQRTWTK